MKVKKEVFLGSGLYIYNFQDNTNTSIISNMEIESHKSIIFEINILSNKAFLKYYYKDSEGGLPLTINNKNIPARVNFKLSNKNFIQIDGFKYIITDSYTYNKKEASIYLNSINKKDDELKINADIVGKLQEEVEKLKNDIELEKDVIRKVGKFKEVSKEFLKFVKSLPKIISPNFDHEIEKYIKLLSKSEKEHKEELEQNQTDQVTKEKEYKEQLENQKKRKKILDAERFKVQEELKKSKVEEKKILQNEKLALLERIKEIDKQQKGE